MNWLLKLICFLSVCFLVRTDADADEDRKTKALSCISLVRAGLHHNDDYFNYVAYSIDANDSEDLIKKWTAKAMLNCYNTVSLLKSANLISRKSYKNISPFEKENEEILAIEKFKTKYGNDNDRQVKDNAKLQNILKGLKEELNELEQVVRQNAREFVAKFRQEEQRTRQEEPEDVGGRYENSNLNLSLVTKMNPTVKIAVGFGILAIIAFSLYLGYKALTKEKAKKVKKNK